MSADAFHQMWKKIGLLGIGLLAGCGVPGPPWLPDPTSCQEMMAQRSGGAFQQISFHLWQKQDLMESNRVQYHLGDPSGKWTQGSGLFVCGPEGFNNNKILQQSLYSNSISAAAPITDLYGTLGWANEKETDFLPGTYEVLVRQGKNQLRKTLVLKDSPHLHRPELEAFVLFNNHLYFSLKTSEQADHLRVSLLERGDEQPIAGYQRLMLPVEVSPDPVLGQYRVDLSRSLLPEEQKSNLVTGFYVMYKEGTSGLPMEYTNTFYSSAGGFYYMPIVQVKFENLPKTLKVGQQVDLKYRVYAQEGVQYSVDLRTGDIGLTRLEGTTLTALQPGQTSVLVQATDGQFGLAKLWQDLTIVP